MSSVIEIPPLGVDTTVTLINWLVAVGDEVAAGDVVAELESDKTVVELAVEQSGYIASLDVAAGTENLVAGMAVAQLVSSVPEMVASTDATVSNADAADRTTSAIAVDPVITEAVSTGDDHPRLPEPAASELPVSRVDAAPQPEQLTPLARRIVERAGETIAEPAASVLRETTAGSRVTARDLGFLALKGGQANVTAVETSQPASVTPLAGRMLELTGQAPDTYRASGPGGRLLARDVGIKFEPGASSQGGSRHETETDYNTLVETISAPWTEIEATSVRRQVASRLQQSKQQAPHYYMSRSIVADNIIELRKIVNEQLPESERISLNDVIVHLVARVLHQDNALNACWIDNTIRQFTRIDIAVAVAGKRGLMTPVLRDAASLGLKQTASELRPLVDKAMKGKLLPNEYQGGTFTISNLGMYGVDTFAAILNPPQAAILAIGATGSELELNNGEVVSKQKFTATLSVDHRVADGVDGARFLEQFSALAEDPRRLLL